MRVALVLASDRVARGDRRDATEAPLRAVIEERGGTLERVRVVEDDVDALTEALLDLCAAVDLVLTSGGTGLAPRDVTPEATLGVIERELPGFGEAMRAASFPAVPTAIVSRATAGVRGRALVVNLPGSPRGACECLELVWPAARHVVELLAGSVTDCVPPADAPGPTGRRAH